MNKLIFYDNYKEGRKIYIRFNLIIVITILMVVNLVWICALIYDAIKVRWFVNTIVVLIDVIYIFVLTYNFLWFNRYELFAFSDRITIRGVFKKIDIPLNEITSHEYKKMNNLYVVTIFLIDNRKHLFEFTKRKKVIYTTHYSEFAELLKNS